FFKVDRTLPMPSENGIGYSTEDVILKISEQITDTGKVCSEVKRIAVQVSKIGLRQQVDLLHSCSEEVGGSEGIHDVVVSKSYYD
ncbi:hypothetical protein QFC19_008456, partial [Naganishia cerealis]